MAAFAYSPHRSQWLLVPQVIHFRDKSEPSVTGQLGTLGALCSHSDTLGKRRPCRGLGGDRDPDTHWAGGRGGGDRFRRPFSTRALLRDSATSVH